MDCTECAARLYPGHSSPYCATHACLSAVLRLRSAHVCGTRYEMCWSLCSPHLEPCPVNSAPHWMQGLSRLYLVVFILCNTQGAAVFTCLEFRCVAGTLTIVHLDHPSGSESCQPRKCYWIDTRACKAANPSVIPSLSDADADASVLRSSADREWLELPPQS